MHGVNGFIVGLNGTAQLVKGVSRRPKKSAHVVKQDFRSLKKALHDAERYSQRPNEAGHVVMGKSRD